MIVPHLINIDLDFRTRNPGAILPSYTIIFALLSTKLNAKKRDIVTLAKDLTAFLAHRIIYLVRLDASKVQNGPRKWQPLCVCVFVKP